jgi:hypothetical protein
MTQSIHLNRRPFVCRFWRNYFGWRAIFGPWAAIKAAWWMARS